VGSAAQFAVQLPFVLGLVRRFRPRPSLAEESTRQVLRGFGPVVVGRGVVQVSAYVDTYYASLISEVAFSALNYAQQLSLLPVSLFGMAVSASELVEMSRTLGEGGDVAAALRTKIDAGLARIAFYVVPSSAAFLFIGDALAAPLFQSGRFGPADTRLIWYLLVGSAVGLVASTFGRLYSSSFYALKDTRTPLYTATARVVLTAALAYWSAVKLPEQLGVPRVIGGVGITATTGVAAWVEYLLLRHLLGKRIGSTGLPLRRSVTFYGAALVAGLAALGVKVALVRAFGSALGPEVWGSAVLPAPSMNRFLFAGALIGTFGVTYLALALALGEPEVRSLAGKVGRRLGRR
jgi:putative peptidoglycan lipid II flippase